MSEAATIVAAAPTAGLTATATAVMVVADEAAAPADEARLEPNFNRQTRLPCANQSTPIPRAPLGARGLLTLRGPLAGRSPRGCAGLQRKRIALRVEALVAPAEVVLTLPRPLRQLAVGGLLRDGERRLEGRREQRARGCAS